MPNVFFLRFLTYWVSLPVLSCIFRCKKERFRLCSYFAISLVPILTVSSSISSDQFSALYPANNTIILKVRTEDFSLSVNLPGRWILPDYTYRSALSVSYDTLDYQYFGMYQYLINNWDRNEVIAIQIILISDGNCKLSITNNANYC